jgi:hypothetical protein
MLIKMQLRIDQGYCMRYRAENMAGLVLPSRAETAQ